LAAVRYVVIIGAGVNGLVTAFYLARAGRKPLVLESRPVVGGAAATGEFHPGFRGPILAHAGGPLLPHIARDLQLERHGLSIVEPEVCVFTPSHPGDANGNRALLLYRDVKKTARGIAQFSGRDAEKYGEFSALLARYGALLRQLLSLTPPVIDKPGSEDLWNLFRFGRNMRGLGKRDMMRLLRYGPMAVADFVAEFFEAELLRAAIAARGVMGSAMGPWSAGSTAHLLLQAATDSHPVGAPWFPRGGMGALSDAIAAAARAAGAEIRCDSPVERIIAKDDAVTGVVLTGGEEITAKAVVSSADPRRTFLKLCDPSYFGPDFLVKIQHFRGKGTLAKVNLALDGLPQFTALASSNGHAGGVSSGAGNGNALAALRGRIHIGSEIDYMERAFDASKYGEFSPHPWLDITIPSLTDSSLAPAGKHVMSIYAQYAPYKLKDGDWTTRRDEFLKIVITTLAEYAPDLPQRVMGAQLITPVDLEREWGLTGGHIFHGELSLDQLFTMRPLIGWARYRTPVRGLYLCGSGTHPGTGLNGASGANAAREILKDSAG
jgi:phytoene dehydrogenase-like protein